MRRRVRFDIAVLLVFGLALVATARAQEPPLSSASSHSVLERMLLRSKSRSDYITAVVSQLRRSDRDNNGLDAGDVEAIALPKRARIRADRLLSVLVHDLNGDGRIARDEIERGMRWALGLPFDGPLEPRASKKVSQRVEKHMEPDSNADGVITYEEAIQPQKSDRSHWRNEQSNIAASLLALDPNNDGQLTEDELTKLAEETFQHYDVDGNNELWRHELKDLHRRVHGGSR